MREGIEQQPPNHALLVRLIGYAFNGLAGTEPVVVSVDNDMRVRLEHGWRTQFTRSAEDLGSTATKALQSSPVLLVPPWERLTSPPPDGLPLRAVEQVAVAAVRPTGPDALFAAVLPVGDLVNQLDQGFRELISNIWQPRLVIYAEHVFSGISQQVQAAVVFWRQRRQQPSPLLLFRVPRHPRPAEVEDDFRSLIARADGRGRFGYQLPQLPDTGSGYSFDLNNPAYAARLSDLRVWGKEVSLGAAFTFPAPALEQSRDRNRLHEQAADGLVRVVSGRDLRRDGRIAGPDDLSRWAEVGATHRLQAGDLLMRRMIAPNARGPLVVVEVTAEDLPVATDNSVVTLRPIAALDGPQRLIAGLFLRSQIAHEYVVAHRFGTLSPTILSKMPLPQPDLALSATLEGLEAAREQLQKWRDEAEALLTSVFEDESAVAARHRILASGRRLRMRVDAAELLDDFGYQVRTRYPHPIAYRWSEVQAHRSRGAYRAAYDAILETSEVLLCYVALVAISLAYEAGRTVGAMSSIRNRLSRSGTNGPGFGDWSAVLQEIADSRAFRGLPDDNPLNDVRRAYADPHATAARKRLASRRNDRSHLRRVDDRDLPGAVTDAYADLATLLKQASFLTDLPLIHVTAVRWDALHGIGRVGYQELIGDNVIVPDRGRSYGSSDLEIGSLYVGTSDGRLHLMRPFLVRRQCPICRGWETFHLDAAPDSESVTIKSLERGHVDSDPDLFAVLQHVGLLG
ncbi:hypothetical protein AB0J86_12985 [Micromonospora sp. NPDC049559]|uniref:hypothetical protein n=1 Tax=Micromonospora sp. NPDC049559 TaxID=3155923 RepID=UPI00343BF42D